MTVVNGMEEVGCEVVGVGIVVGGSVDGVEGVEVVEVVEVRFGSPKIENISSKNSNPSPPAVALSVPSTLRRRLHSR